MWKLLWLLLALVPPPHTSCSSSSSSLRGLPDSGRDGGGGGGHWSLQLSPNSVSTVPFRGRRISVWEHATEKGRYYSMPLVELLPETARTFYSILVGQYVMQFDVLAWTDEMGSAVFRHLQEEGMTGQGGENLTMRDVELLPMEKVRLVWRGSAPLQQNGFELQNKWTSNTNLPSVLAFHFTCSKEPVCDGLAEAMRERPEVFNGFELEYIINGQRSARRQVTITGSNVMGGNLHARLRSMPVAGGGGGTRYLNSEDMNMLVYESALNVVASVVSDSDYVDAEDDVSVSRLIERELTRERMSSEQLTPRMWDSVFWDPAFARPDRLAKSLNKVLSMDHVDNRTLIFNEQFSSQNSSSSDENEKGESNVSGLLRAHVVESGSGSSLKKVNKEGVLRTLSEGHRHVEWTGEVFRAKPMVLFRVNLSSFRSRSNIAVANLQVHRYETVHSVKVTSSSMNYGSRGETINVWSEIEHLEGRFAKVTEDLKESIDRNANRFGKRTNADAAKIAELEEQLEALEEKNSREIGLVKRLHEDDTSGLQGQVLSAFQDLPDLLNESTDALRDELSASRQRIDGLNEAVGDLGRDLEVMGEQRSRDAASLAGELREVRRATDDLGRPVDCTALKMSRPGAETGVFRLNLLPGHPPKAARCNVDSVPEGATVVLRRGQFGTYVDFDRDWTDYVEGFGTPDGEFWLGLKWMHVLTSSRARNSLRVDVVGPDGTEYYIVYEEVFVGDATTGYELHLGKKVRGNMPSDDLRFHDGMAFSTKDRDNDKRPNSSCAVVTRAGWWFKNCYASLLTGAHGSRRMEAEDGYKMTIHWKGITAAGKANWWDTWNSLQAAEMMLY